jgi:TatD DNase family protein
MRSWWCRRHCWKPAAAAAAYCSIPFGVLGFATIKSQHYYSYRCHHRRFLFMNSNTNNYKKSMSLIDVDCNLWHADLNKNLLDNKEELSPLSILLEDAVEESNIIAMVSPSSTIQEAKHGLALLKERQQLQQHFVKILTTVGVHPYHVNDIDTTTTTGLRPPIHEYYDEMKQLIQHHSSLVCAVGECGLDSSPGFPPIIDQIPWFQLQIKLAQELNLPLFVHERGAFQETMDLLKEFHQNKNNGETKVIIHCFTGTPDECQQYMDRGYYISLSGYICKPANVVMAQECLRHIIPLDKLMLETDAPYMGFPKCRQSYLDKNIDSMIHNTTTTSKQRKKFLQGTYPNVPSSLPMVLDQVVKLLDNPDLTHEKVAQQTTANAIAFFGFQL